MDNVLLSLSEWIKSIIKEDKKHEQFTNYRSRHSSISGID